jgi:hypothetical protein
MCRFLPKKRPCLFLVRGMRSKRIPRLQYSIGPCREGTLYSSKSGFFGADNECSHHTIDTHCFFYRSVHTNRTGFPSKACHAHDQYQILVLIYVRCVFKTIKTIHEIVIVPGLITQCSNLVKKPNNGHFLSRI